MTNRYDLLIQSIHQTDTYYLMIFLLVCGGLFSWYGLGFLRRISPAVENIFKGIYMISTLAAFVYSVLIS